MPGAKDANLRSGHLHEELGVLLLKSICLVAPVPHQEDAGIDAFATLLRTETTRRLVPGESFLVQLKASSVRTIEFMTREEADWLYQLEIPLFIGSVDLTTSSIALYATHRVNQVFLEERYQKVQLQLDNVIERTSPHRDANIGPPVLTWSAKNIGDRAFIQAAYNVLTPHVQALRRNYFLRSIGAYEVITWTEGAMPDVQDARMFLVTGSTQITKSLEQMKNHLYTFYLDMLKNKRYSELPTITSFVELMRKHGVDPDPGNTFLQFVCSLADGEELSEEDIVRLRTLFRKDDLNLARTMVTDAALAFIPETVQYLALVGTKITDEGLGHLLRLTSLRRVNLSQTQVSDQGLRKLEGLPHLEWICVDDTKVTDAGREWLRECFRGIEIAPLPSGVAEGR